MLNSKTGKVVEQMIPKLFGAGALALWGEPAAAGLIQPGVEMVWMWAHQHQQPSTLEGKIPRSWSKALYSSVWWLEMKLWAKVEREVLTGDKETFFRLDCLAGLWVALGAMLAPSFKLSKSWQGIDFISELLQPKQELETSWPLFPPGFSCDPVLATIRSRLSTHIDVRGKEPNNTSRSCFPLILGDPKGNSNIT